jgi:sulfite reductase (ferredoxin)
MLRYEIPASLAGEIDRLDTAVKEFRDGTLPAARFKGMRVPFGIYEQRRDDTYMVRIRLAAGVVTPAQLREIAALAARYGSGALHATSRQAIQIHDVRLEDTVEILRGLLGIGLATRGGGGNTVRNIVASADSGIDPESLFDVTPYALALTTALIAEPDSWGLPRKYKIAFSDSAKDSAFAGFTDLGFIASVKDGRKGFRVYIAGGLGKKPQAGRLLYEFVTPDRIYPIAEGLKQLFDKHGNRKDRNSARMRFLWESLGETRFVRLLEEEITAVDKTGQRLEVSEDYVAPVPEPAAEAKTVSSNGFGLWKARYVREQKQEGLFRIKIPLCLGDITTADADSLGAALGLFGDDVLRLTMSQNIHLRNIPGAYLGNIYETVSGLNTLSGFAEVLGDMVACTGSDTCKLGITLSRGAAQAAAEKLDASGLDLDAAGGTRIQVSGCPNSCGRHITADLGFFGKAGRKGGRLYPAYTVVAGGSVGEAGPRLCDKLGEVSARDLPALAADILKLYIENRSGYASFQAFAAGGGADLIRKACAGYADIPPFLKDRNYYYDWGADEPFSLAGRTAGECSAGVLDMIELDAAAIKEGRARLRTAAEGKERADIVYQTVSAASRMLLVTRGVDPRNDTEVFDSFERHFIDTGYIDPAFRPIIAAARSGDNAALSAAGAQTDDLCDAVLELYRSMDNAFNFGGAATPAASPVGTDRKGSSADRSGDYRGVKCPINFTRISIDLSSLRRDQILEALLDDGEPIENVPGSLRAAGHEILERKRVGDYWSLLIKKM